MAAGHRRFGTAFLAVLLCAFLWLFWGYQTYQLEVQRLLQQLQSSPKPDGKTSPAVIADGSAGGSHVPHNPAPPVLAPGIHKIQPGAKEKAVEDNAGFWRDLPQQYPVASLRPVPSAGGAKALGRVQTENHDEESTEHREERAKRREEIKEAFKKAWAIYKDRAWLHDEVAPVSQVARDNLGGWAATLVDALDTLWIMDLKDEFEEAVEAIHKKVSFRRAKASGINVFETNIRFLGGFLSAYDLSGDKRLLEKATQVGDMLYHAFDTDSRMPILRWYLHDKAQGDSQEVPSAVLLAEFGSLSLEMTRLSIVTGDAKYHDATLRVSEALAAAQETTKIPGLWSTLQNLATMDLDAGGDYTLGGMADSAYEYLLKMAVLVGDQEPLYRTMYDRAVEAAKKHLFFRPMTPTGEDILFPGIAHKAVRDDAADPALEYNGQHLTCFVGGMLLLGGRVFSNPEHEELGVKLTKGCVWAYGVMPSGIMPESFHLAPCPDEACKWDETHWHNSIKGTSLFAQHPDKSAEELIAMDRLPEGFTSIDDRRYQLRPEAIESVFYLYRVTGDRQLQDTAWDMWKAIDKATRTEKAHSTVWDVAPDPAQDPPIMDAMESFWLAETLKYFYLVFSEPDVLSLDEWVFNTEAHPFKRMLP